MSTHIEVVVNIGDICPVFSEPFHLRVDGSKRVCNLRQPIPGPDDRLKDSRTKCPFSGLFVVGSLAPMGIDSARSLQARSTAHLEIRCPGCEEFSKFVEDVSAPVTACTK